MEENKQVVQQPAGQFDPNRASRPPRFGDRNTGDRNNRGRNNSKGFFKKKPRGDKKQNEEQDKFETKVLQVRRVTRVVKGGKRMRFSALVVVGDKQGKIGYGLEKGADYQESVMKATRKAKEKLIEVKLTENKSISFPLVSSYKSSTIMLKPALTGTGLISGGFIRPVLELAGIQNIYTKIIGTNNKITGAKSVFKALEEVSI
jgi:small subunit ribosomal protein S5